VTNEARASFSQRCSPRPVALIWSWGRVVGETRYTVPCYGRSNISVCTSTAATTITRRIVATSSTYSTLI